MGGLGVERIRFDRLLCRAPKRCGTDVMAVAREVLDQSARVLVVGLEEGYKARHVQWRGRSLKI